MSFRSRKYARVWRKVANFGPYRPPRSKTELPSTLFLIMITTRTSGVSGKLTWWFITLLTFTFHCPSNSIIDPFPSSQSILYFHNFRNRLTWPPRRLQKFNISGQQRRFLIILSARRSSVDSLFVGLWVFIVFCFY